MSIQLNDLENELNKHQLNNCRFCKSTHPVLFQSDRLVVLRCTKCLTPARGYISLPCLKSNVDSRVAVRKLVNSWNERNK